MTFEWLQNVHLGEKGGDAEANHKRVKKIIDKLL
jgi:hypothetical protein